VCVQFALVLAINFAWAIWLGPLIYGCHFPSLNDALLLAGWVLAVAIAAEAYRPALRRERLPRQRHRARRPGDGGPGSGAR
jgi:hypothetical protein